MHVYSNFRPDKISPIWWLKLFSVNFLSSDNNFCLSCTRACKRDKHSRALPTTWTHAGQIKFGETSDPEKFLCYKVNIKLIIIVLFVNVWKWHATAINNNRKYIHNVCLTFSYTQNPQLQKYTYYTTSCTHNNSNITFLGKNYVAIYYCSTSIIVHT